AQYLGNERAVLEMVYFHRMQIFRKRCQAPDSSRPQGVHLAGRVLRPESQLSACRRVRGIVPCHHPEKIEAPREGRRQSASTANATSTTRSEIANASTTPMSRPASNAPAM